MKKSTKLILFIIFIFSIISSCKKENLDDRYQEKGNYGNASLTTSTTITLNNWIEIINDGTNFSFEKFVSMTPITQSIIDKGMVVAYASTTPGSWIALPFTYSNSTFQNTLGFNFSVGEIIFTVNGYDVSSNIPSALNYDGIQVKIVTISAEGKVANPNLDLNDYNAVKKAFNLKD